jgi:glycosyltransferase involved in cell wall biosynthesis
VSIKKEDFDSVCIVHLISFLSFYGGTVRKYFSWIKSSSFRRHLFLLYEGQKNIETTSNEFQRNGAQVFILKNKMLIFQLYSILTILRNERKVIILGHHFRGAFLAFVLKVIKKIPIVIPLHGAADLFNPFKRFIYKLLLRFSSKVIYNSNHTSRSYGDIGKSVIIYNGLYYTNIPSKNAFKPTKPVRLCSIGVLTEVKNHKLLIDMMTRLSDNFILTIIGEGKERDNLQFQVEQLNLENRVFLPGRLHDAYKFIAENDIYLHPSKNESFGMAVLEALFARVPVVVTDCCATIEIIAGGKYGWIAPANDPNSWANAVMEIIHNHELAWMKAKNGKEWAVKMFSDNTFAIQMDSLIRSFETDEVKSGIENCN